MRIHVDYIISMLGIAHDWLFLDQMPSELPPPKTFDTVVQGYLRSASRHFAFYLSIITRKSAKDTFLACKLRTASTGDQPDLVKKMEQTLFICREVDLFRIPPRTGRGHISGEWRTDDKIFTARCRVVAVGDQVEVRLEDPSK